MWFKAGDGITQVSVGGIPMTLDSEGRFEADDSMEGTILGAGMTRTAPPPKSDVDQTAVQRLIAVLDRTESEPGPVPMEINPNDPNGKVQV